MMQLFKIRLQEFEDWFTAITCINLTSHLMSYFHISRGNMPETHERLKAGRAAFKMFCQLNSANKKTFFEIQSQALIYTYHSWCVQSQI